MLLKVRSAGQLVSGKETHSVLRKMVSMGQDARQSTVHKVLSTSSSDGSGGSSAA